LQRLVLAQLVEVVLLAADADVEPDSRRIAQRRQHRDLVIAEDDVGVRTVARVAHAADAEHAVVHEVTKEDRVPTFGGIRLQRDKEALDVAVDVADDQDWQIARSHSSSWPSTRRTARV